jgi:hypothetical protein
MQTRRGREQPGLGLDEDAAADQALELGADVLGVLGYDRQVLGDAQVAGSQGAAEVGEGGKDLLVGGVVRYRWIRLGRLRRGLAVVLPGGEIRVLRVTCRPLIASLSSRSLAVSSSIKAWPASRVRVSSRASILSSRNLPGSAVVAPAVRWRGRAGQLLGHRVKHRPIHPRRGARQQSSQRPVPYWSLATASQFTMKRH